MGSPFAGIDPYLEAPGLWEDVHANLATEIRAQLQPLLIPRYVAVLTPYVTYEDVVIAEPTVVKPDVAILERTQRRQPTAGTAIAPAPLTGTAVIETLPVPSRAQRIEVRRVGNETLVSVIEILSPSNKRQGSESFDAYQQKRRDLLHSDVHLLEIDLLRRGMRWPLNEPLPAAPYFVFLSRADLRPTVEIWPLTFNDTVPILPVPLRTPDADVPLDLGVALARVYELGAYNLRIDYRQPPPKPDLSTEESYWFEAQLKRAGLR